MTLRLMQIFVPDSADDALGELLEGREILGRWRDDETDQIVLQLLLPAEESEPVMDRFEQRFAGAKGFHVVLFAVEAVLPRPEPEPPEEKVEEPAAAEPSENEKTEPERISREELYNDVSDELGVTAVFLGLTVLSAVVAAVGLQRNDVAVIIGAMVIAPLLGPNVAMSLSTTLGDFDLLRRAILTNVAGIATAFALSVLLGLLFDVDPNIPAIKSRTNVGPGDMLLALSAGAAGTLAFTRGLSGPVIGVMVAVALIPPLVVCGMLFGAGQFHLAGGALLLTSANVVCINLAGIATFLFQGVRPRSWWEEERAKKATHRAIITWIVLLAALGLILWLNR